MTAPEIFISHTHSDKAIADALRDAVHTLFGDAVTVEYSTNKEADGGVGHGADWFRWIQERVGAAQVALILLTPSSIQKPWVLWEAGAVAGAAIAAGGGVDKVRPLSFQLASGQVPQPFQRVQVEAGDRKEGATRFFEQLLDVDFAAVITPARLREAGKRLDGVVEEYLGRVRTAMLDAPSLPTEQAIQEWCARLDDLREANRVSETRQIHAWLEVAFGRDIDGVPSQIDLRIHRRLGSLYLAAADPTHAVEQFRLARTLAPRDMFILRQLGQALLDVRDFSGAKEVIDRMKDLYPRAFEENAECAAFLAKWSRRQGDLVTACEVYQRALAANPLSYYLADVLAQTLLERNLVEEARTHFARALEIVDSLGETNVWSHATAATAAMAIGAEDKAAAYLRAIATDADVSAGDRGTIEAAMQHVADRLGRLEQWASVWRPLLRGATR